MHCKNMHIFFWKHFNSDIMKMNLKEVEATVQYYKCGDHSSGFIDALYFLGHQFLRDYYSKHIHRIESKVECNTAHINLNHAALAPSALCRQSGEVRPCNKQAIQISDKTSKTKISPNCRKPYAQKHSRIQKKSSSSQTAAI